MLIGTAEGRQSGVTGKQRLLNDRQVATQRMRHGHGGASSPIEAGSARTALASAAAMSAKPKPLAGRELLPVTNGSIVTNGIAVLGGEFGEAVAAMAGYV